MVQSYNIRQYTELYSVQRKNEFSATKYVDTGYVLKKTQDIQAVLCG